MNRKIMWLMVGLVAAVLPAVAVADVMLSASVNGSEMVQSDGFYVQAGPNYANAHALAGLTWTSQVNSESEYLGSISLGYMTNETITEVNVLDVNFTGLVGSATFSITVSVPDAATHGSTPFQAGSYIYITNSTQSLVPLPSSISLSNSGSTTLTFTVTSSSTIYIGFTVGSGAGGGTFQLGMELIEN